VELLLLIFTATVIAIEPKVSAMWIVAQSSETVVGEVI
jgi:hypothetical protein